MAIVGHRGTDTELVVPEKIDGKNVIHIYDWAFSTYRGSSITSIAIPDSVTSIGEGAFYYCASLANIIIPNSVESIGEGL